MDNKYYKHQVEKLIQSMDTVIISLVRKTKVSDGYGGFTKSEQVLKPQIFGRDSKKISRSTATDTGEVYSSQTVMKLLAKSDADIKEGDTFSIDNKTYKVAHIQLYQGICYQVEIEVVK